MKINNHNNEKLQNFQKFIKLMTTANLEQNKKQNQNISKVEAKNKN